MDQVENETIAGGKPGGMSRERKVLLALVVVLLIVVVGMYSWKVASVDAVENELGEVEAKLAQVEVQQAEAYALLVKQAQQLDDRRAEEALRLFSIPFAWAIRRELIAGNLAQVDQYFGELVQIRGFKSAILAKLDGKVIVASDRKQLVETFSSLYPGADLDSNEITVERASNGNFRAVIPILGLNKHLGTAVLEYLPPAYPLQ